MSSMRRLTWILLGLWLLCLAPALAQEKPQTEPWTGKLADGKVITKADLDKILHGHKLWLESGGKAGQQANLSMAKLRWANLDNANLSGAKLRSADLKLASLSRTKLYKADLSGTYLNWANLMEANLNMAYLRGANLKNANLYKANLLWANLHTADLSGAKLKEADLCWANLSEANLIEADLPLAKLSAADMKKADLSRANLDNANLSGADLNGANLSGAYLNKAKLNVAGLIGAHLNRAYLSGADLIEARLNTAYLDSANLSGANLYGAHLDTARLVNANLSGAHLEKGELHKSDLREANLNNADLSGAKLIEANLSGAYLGEANLSGANLGGALFVGANLGGARFEPKPGTLPEVSKLLYLRGLDTLTFEGTASYGLMDLREIFKKAGMRDEERQVTYALNHTRRVNAWKEIQEEVKKIKEKAEEAKRAKEKKKPKEEVTWLTVGIAWLEDTFQYVMFEWTCKWGMSPGRPLRIMFLFLFVFTLPYLLALRSRKPKNGIWLTLLPDRVLDRHIKDRPVKLTFRPPCRPLPARWWARFGARGRRAWRGLRLAFYFSLLSAFNIGWRELNVGTWLTRIQRREYLLKGTGWVRMVAGIQSLLSVYLLALWALTYFGRPFE